MRECSTNDGSYQTDETRAVDASSAASQKAQNGDRAADENKDRRKFFEERQETGSRYGAKQIDVDCCLWVDMHPEAKA